MIKKYLLILREHLGEILVKNGKSLERYNLFQIHIDEARCEIKPTVRYKSSGYTFDGEYYRQYSTKDVVFKTWNHLTWTMGEYN